MTNKLAIVLWVALAVVGCSGGGGGSTPGGGPLTSAQWQQDIDFVTTQMESRHPDLFHAVSKQAFQVAVDALKADIPDLTRNEIFVRIKELVALPSMELDGHTEVPMFRGTDFRVFPLRLYEFSDGVFVIDANPPYEDAIGQRVVQIGGVDINQINQIIDPMITRDNEATVRFKRTLHYVVPELLEAVGIIQNSDQGDYLLENTTGDFSTLIVEPIGTDVYEQTLGNTVALPEQAEPLYRSDTSEAFWTRLLTDSNALYVKYNFIGTSTLSGLTISDLSNQIATAVAGGNADKIIVDVRHNGGGNNATFGPLVDVLSSAAVDQPKRLYVLIDRVTFSAAANFVAAVNQQTNAIFAGEPTGGSPNNYGDAVQVELPNSGFAVRVPTRYWEFAPNDSRLTTTPDIAVEPTAADYFARRDPVLQAVLDD